MTNLLGTGTTTDIYTKREVLEWGTLHGPTSVPYLCEIEIDDNAILCPAHANRDSPVLTIPQIGCVSDANHAWWDRADDHDTARWLELPILERYLHAARACCMCIFELAGLDSV